MRKRFGYIRIREDEKKPSEASVKRRRKRIMKNIGHALTVVGTMVSSMLLILVIMLCIVATVVTVYILDFADNGYDADLRDAEMKYTTMVYAYDEEGQEVELTRLAADQNRIWVDYENISPWLIKAVISTEDKRFWDHKGVDWRRTVFALGADVLHLSGAGQGGSTITQQLIKNITGDDRVSWERKLREIFRALSLEEKYTKFDILESYLNRIWLGGMVYGVGAASQYYFGKEAKDLTIAESAIIAGMIWNPYDCSPYIDLYNCRYYQEYALRNMYEQGYINTNEYQAALAEKVKFARTVYGDDFGYTDPRSIPVEKTPEEEEEDEEDENYAAYRWNGYEVTQNWYTDAGIHQVIEDYADLKGITYTSARKEILNGGYKIYLNMDMKIQAILEEKFLDPYLVVDFYDETAEEDDLVQAAFVLMNYEGTVVALAGGLGDKPGDNCFNRATMAERAPGSTMKPISVYATAVNQNLITYSTMLPDKKINLLGAGGSFYTWPNNFAFEGQDGSLMPVWKAVRESRNTIAVRVAQMLTPQVCYNQLTQNLGLSTLDPEFDLGLSPVALGALTNGSYLMELAAAYQIFGNGGVYYQPKLYSRVLDSKDNVILRQDYYGTQAVDSDAAWVTNRMMKQVVVAGPGSSSSGYRAKLDNVEVIGKTGTSNSEKDLLFVGCTPNYVGAFWMGYDDGREFPSRSVDGHGWSAGCWHDIMVDIENTEEVNKFTPDSSCVERRYCTETGLQPSAKCTTTEIGYYRKSYLPTNCSGDHEAEINKQKEYWEKYDENIKQEMLNGDRVW